MKKILFVCLGNICRSPAAEGIFSKMVSDYKLENLFKIDSAGTSAYHQGSKSDLRMIEHAKRRGYDLLSISRQLRHSDLIEFDYILAMDRNNYWDILNLDHDKKYRDKVLMMTDYCKKFVNVNEVPDPYHQGEEGFELVLDILEDACASFLETLREK